MTTCGGEIGNEMISLHAYTIERTSMSPSMCVFHACIHV